jgi:hypothetical protein
MVKKEMEYNDFVELSNVLRDSWVYVCDAAEERRKLNVQRDNLMKLYDRINVIAVMSDSFYQEKNLAKFMDELLDLINNFDTITDWRVFDTMSNKIDSLNELVLKQINKLENR